MSTGESLATTAARGTAWASVASIAAKAFGLATAAVTLSALTLSEYGTLQLVLTIFTAGGLFILSPLSDTIVSEVSAARAHDPARARGIVRSYLRAQLNLGVMAAAAVFLVGGPVAEWYAGVEVASAVRLVSLFFLLAPLKTAVTVLFTAEMCFASSTFHAVAEEMLRLIATTALLWWSGFGVAGVLVAQLLAKGGALLLIAPTARRVYRRMSSAGSSVSVVDLLLQHGKWALMVSHVGTLNNNVRQWIVGVIMGVEVVALSSVASTLFGHVKSLIPFSNVMLALVPRHISEEERVSRILSKSLKYLTLSSLVLGVVMALVVPVTIMVLFPHYIASLPLFELLLMGLLPNALAVVLTPVFHALRQQKDLFFAYLWRIAVTVALLPPLLHFFGLYGIAIEFLLGSTLFAFERYRIVRQTMPLVTFSPRAVFSHDEYDNMIVGRILSLVRRAPVLRFFM